MIIIAKKTLKKLLSKYYKKIGYIVSTVRFGKLLSVKRNGTLAWRANILFLIIKVPYTSNIPQWVRIWAKL